MTRARAVGFLVATALLWSLGGLLIKSVDWHPMAIAGSRSVLAAATLWIAFRPLRLSWSLPQIGGAVAYAATVVLFVLANKMTTAANAILLQYTAPIYVGLFGGWFLKEKTTRFDWGIILLALSGMTLFFLDELSSAGLWGNVLSLVSGVTFAWLPLFLRKGKGASAGGAIFLGNCLAVLVCLPWMFRSAVPASSLPYLLVLGVGQLGLAYVFYAKAMPHVTAVEAILVPFIEPILNPIWVLLVLGERPGPMAVVGGVIVLASVAARGLKGSRFLLAGKGSWKRSR